MKRKNKINNKNTRNKSNKLNKHFKNGNVTENNYKK